MHKDIHEIDPYYRCHELNIDSAYPVVKQKSQCFSPENNKTITDEVDRLLEIGAIEDCKYSDWVSNLVVVKKKNGKDRVCINFTNLHKACLKDSFPLPKIDQMVDATTRYPRMSFLDTYSGYNHTPMKKEDRIHTTFTTHKGLLCYKVMPFGLENVGATYLRLMNKILDALLGKTMEIYIDDMVITSKE